MLSERVDNKGAKLILKHEEHSGECSQNIFNLRYEANLFLKVETNRADPHKPRQYHNCNNHYNKVCKKPAAKPATYGNFGGEHLVSYIGYKENLPNGSKQEQSSITSTTATANVLNSQNRK